MIHVDPQADDANLSAFRKLWAGNHSRKSRLHDEFGTRICAGRLIRNGPRALWSGAARLLAGWRQERPWISYDAQALLARHLGPSSRVLEFGSGMSTMWYARHAADVVSVEDYRIWFDVVAPRIKALGNVRYLFAGDQAAYTGLVPDERFDLVMIDGSYRDDCAVLAIERLAKGGVIYLDNCDHGPGALTGDVPRARQVLLSYAAAAGVPVHEFTDFAPTQLHVQRGMWIGPLPR